MSTIDQLQRMLARCEHDLETAKARLEQSGTATDKYLVICAEKRVEDYRKQIARRRAAHVEEKYGATRHELSEG